MIRALLALLLLPCSAARAEEPGDFDYWILALSWSPGWCAAEGGPDEPQCDPAADRAWVLHGLWPQHEEGWPAWCDSPHPGPTPRQVAAMADLMPSAALVRHAWRKHGSCSGLAPGAYLALARRAWDRVTFPAALAALDRPVTLPAALVEEAFLRADPRLAPEAVTVTCREGRIREVRLCLTRDDLAPRPCGADARRDCRLGDALLDPVP